MAFIACTSTSLLIKYMSRLNIPNHWAWSPKPAIENLQAQMEKIEHDRASSIQFTPVEPGQIATVAVAPGPGIARVFASLGVSAIVEGGQTMNPFYPGDPECF